MHNLLGEIGNIRKAGDLEYLTSFIELNGLQAILVLVEDQHESYIFIDLFRLAHTARPRTVLTQSYSAEASI